MKKILLSLLFVLGVMGVKAADSQLLSLHLGADNWPSIQNYTSTVTSTDGNWTLVNFNNNNNGWTFVKCGSKNGESTGEVFTAKAVEGTVNSVIVKINKVNEPAALKSVKLYVSDAEDFAGATETTLPGELEAGDNTFTISAPKANMYYKVAFECEKAAANGVVWLDDVVLMGDGEGETPVEPDPVKPGEGLASLADFFAQKPSADTQVNASLTAIYQDGKDLWVVENGTYALVYGQLNQTYKNGDKIPAPVTGKYDLYNGMPEFVPAAATFLAGEAGTPVAAQAVEIGDLTVADAARYVRIEGVTIEAVEGNDQNFTMTDETGSITLRSRYKNTVTITPAEDATVYGFVGVYNDAVQVYPILIETESTGGGDDPQPSEGSEASFDFTAPATLTPEQAMPVTDGPVNLTNTVLTSGDVEVSFYVPEELAGKTKDPRLYLYKGNSELRMYSGTSMTVSSTNGSVITKIECEASYDDNFNGTASTGTVETGKTSTWTGSAQSVTFNWTGTTKMNKMVVTYGNGSGIEAVEADANAPVEYFNLQGMRVNNPANGIFIRVQGSRVSKVLVK